VWISRKVPNFAIWADPGNGHVKTQFSKPCRKPSALRDVRRCVAVYFGKSRSSGYAQGTAGAIRWPNRLGFVGGRLSAVDSQPRALLFKAAIDWRWFLTLAWVVRPGNFVSHATNGGFCDPSPPARGARRARALFGSWGASGRICCVQRFVSA